MGLFAFSIMTAAGGSPAGGFHSLPLNPETLSLGPFKESDVAYLRSKSPLGRKEGPFLPSVPQCITRNPADLRPRPRNRTGGREQSTRSAKPLLERPPKGKVGGLEVLLNCNNLCGDSLQGLAKRLKAKVA